MRATPLERAASSVVVVGLAPGRPAHVLGTIVVLASIACAAAVLLRQRRVP